MRPHGCDINPAASISDQESEQILTPVVQMAEHQRAAKTGRSIYFRLRVIEIIQPGVKVRRCWRAVCAGISPTTGAPPVAATVALRYHPSLLQWSSVDRLATRETWSRQGKYVQPQQNGNHKKVMRIHCDRNNQATNKTKMAQSSAS